LAALKAWRKAQVFRSQRLKAPLEITTSAMPAGTSGWSESMAAHRTWGTIQRRIRSHASGKGRKGDCAQCGLGLTRALAVCVWRTHIAPSVDPAHCGSALRSLDHLGGAVHPNGAPRRSHDSCGDAQVGAPPAAQVQHGLTEAEGRSSQCEKRTASGAGRLPHRSWEAVGKRGGVAEREGPAQATRCHAAAGAGCVPSRGTLLPPARFGEGRKTVEHRLGEPPPAGHGPGRAPSGEMEAMKMGAEALSQQMTWFYLLDADSR